MKQNDDIDIMSKRCWHEGKIPRAKDWRGRNKWGGIKSSRKCAHRCKDNVEMAHRIARAMGKQKLLKELKDIS